MGRWGINFAGSGRHVGLGFVGGLDNRQALVDWGLPNGFQGITVHSMAELITFCTKFPVDDYALLEAVSAHERLKRGDIVRRALRAYAAQLGVSVDVQPAKKTKASKPTKR